MFTPHLLPIARGIFSTIYLRFREPVPSGEMWTAFAGYTAREPFVKLLPDGSMAELAMVRGTNDCHHDTGVGTLGFGTFGERVGRSCP